MAPADPATITIGIDPTIELGPITIAWHGLTIAIGILVGGILAAAEARRRGLDPDRLYTIGLLVVLGALIGGRVFFLVEHGLLADPEAWFSSTGFTFYGGFIAAAAGIVLYLRWGKLSLAYLDAIAVALPLGIAVGRIGDVINGEHFGPATDFFLGVRNSHPEALTPSPDLAYHSGGLYEVLLGLAVFAIVWPLRRRLARPLAMTWLVIALLAAGRFAEFYVRSDSPDLALGLEIAQWTSLALLVAAAIGAWVTLAGPAGAGGRERGPRRSKRLPWA